MVRSDSRRRRSKETKTCLTDVSMFLFYFLYTHKKKIISSPTMKKSTGGYGFEFAGSEQEMLEGEEWTDVQQIYPFESK